MISAVSALALRCVIVIWFVSLHFILGKIGWPSGWAFVAIFPPAAMVLLWCIAFGRWHARPATSNL